MKKTVSQIRDAIKFRYEHLFRLIESCEKSDQLDSVQNLHDDLRNQLDRMIEDNKPFLFGVEKYTKDTQQVLRYYDDKYWGIKFEKLNKF